MCDWHTKQIPIGYERVPQITFNMHAELSQISAQFAETHCNIHLRFMFMFITAGWQAGRQTAPPHIQ